MSGVCQPFVPRPNYPPPHKYSPAMPGTHSRPTLQRESLDQAEMRLVAGTASLGDDTLHLVDLALGTAERTQALLCQLAGTLILAVADKFDDAALVGSEAVRSQSARSPCEKS